MFTGERLIIGRHGLWDIMTGGLSTDGQNQARQLAPQLGDYLGQLCDPDSTRIISSLAVRAFEFAEIIATELRLGDVINDIGLGRADGRAASTDFTISRLSAYLNNPALILITHMRPAWDLSTALFKGRINDVQELDSGSALGFNTQTKEVILFQG